MKHLPTLMIAIMIASSTGRPALAQNAVAVELVIAVDTSASVDDREFALQMQGIAWALRRPEVIDLITRQDGVAVGLIQWAGWAGGPGTIPWRRLEDRASVLAFAAEVAAARREEVGYLTAIGTLIESALDALETNRFIGKRRIIDIAGDGQSNAGPGLPRPRRRAEAMSVAINGLTILTDEPHLDVYYRRNVIAGPGAFVIDCVDFESVGEAMRRKLLRELGPPQLASN